VPYRILTTKQVEKQINALPHQIADRIEQHIEALRNDPRPSGVKKLKGQAKTYRVRVGNWRIIYIIDDSTQEIILLTVDDRKDVYR
jgi:mRNA interferase RelE/StbE